MPDNRAFKDFVRDNIAVITAFGLNVGQVAGFRLESRQSPLKIFFTTFAAIYSTNLNCLQTFDSPRTQSEVLIRLLIPKPIVNGLIAAVVVAPVNSREYIPATYTFNWHDNSRVIMNSWGDKQGFLDWFEGGKAGSSLVLQSRFDFTNRTATFHPLFRASTATALASSASVRRAL